MGDLFSGLARFFGELRRRRVFRVAGVYAVAGWVVIQGAGAILPILEAPLWIAKVVLVLVFAGFVLAVALAWAFDVTPTGIVRTSAGHARSAADAGDLDTPAAGPLRPVPLRPRGLVALSAGVLLALAALGTYRVLLRRGTAPRETPITSVAVLPFSNLSRDPDNEYFSDGLADELLDHLAKVPGLRVAARTSSFYFKGKNLPVKEIARRLEVESVLEGSVQRVGGRIRLTAQLVSGRTGYHLWSETYDRQAGDLFAVEDDISRAIASALRVELAGGAPVRVHVPDPAVHDLYLRGRFLLNRGSRADLDRSIALFQEAISRDSAFPDAYAAAATAWENLADAYVAPLEAYPKAESLAQRALALDESNAEAHANAAYARMILRWDWAGAEREFRRALQLNPKDAAARVSYGAYLWIRGDARGALAATQDAARLEPFSALYASEVVSYWWLLGEPDSAIAAEKREAEIAPGHVYLGSDVSGAYRAKGRYVEALALDRAAATSMGVPGFGLVEDLVALGRRAEAQAAMGEMVAESRKRYVPAEDIALAALALGRRDEALAWLERGVEDRSALAPFRSWFPQVRPLRSDPRYRRLLRRMGLE